MNGLLKTIDECLAFIDKEFVFLDKGNHRIKNYGIGKHPHIINKGM